MIPKAVSKIERNQIQYCISLINRSVLENPVMVKRLLKLLVGNLSSIPNRPNNYHNSPLQQNSKTLENTKSHGLFLIWQQYLNTCISNKTKDTTALLAEIVAGRKGCEVTHFISLKSGT